MRVAALVLLVAVLVGGAVLLTPDRGAGAADRIDHGSTDWESFRPR